MVARNRRGAVLLEVLVALAILNLAGLGLVEAVESALRAQQTASAQERRMNQADRLLAAMALLTEPDLNRRLGRHPVGDFAIDVQRPERGLYRIAVLDHSQREWLATVVYRPGAQ